MRSINEQRRLYEWKYAQYSTVEYAVEYTVEYAVIVQVARELPSL